MSLDVSLWLANIGLPQYIDNFRDEGIDELSLRELTDANLRELGVLAMGHRKAILRETAKLAGEGHASSSPSLAPTATPQTIFLSYAHKSEREADFDISEDLVLLIQQELEKDGHTVWIDKDGIRAGSQWRERITSAILDHAHFLSFLSVRSVRDPGVCLNEIKQSALSAATHFLQAKKALKLVLAQTACHKRSHLFMKEQDLKELAATADAELF